MIRWRKPKPERAPEVSEEILRLANYDNCYAVWFAKVDALCERLLNVNFFTIFDNACDLDPWEAWDGGVHPGQYFAEVVVPFVVHEGGCDFVDEVIGREAMWGTLLP